MAEYRCYFFGPRDQTLGPERVFAATEIFQARTDDEARVRAHVLSRRGNHAHGFEIWQADALVLRHRLQSDEVRSGHESAPTKPNSRE